MSERGQPNERADEAIDAKNAGVGVEVGGGSSSASFEEGEPVSAVRRALAKGHGDERGGGLPFAASLAGHVALVIGAGAAVWSVSRGPEAPPVLADVEFLDPSLGLREEVELAEADESASLASAIAPESPSIERAAAALEAAPRVERPVAEPPPQLEPRRPAEDDEEAIDFRTARERSEITFATARGGDARDIVYVVDASGSMLATLPIVKAELKRSLSKLDPTQRFQVVFFQAGGFSTSADATGSAGLTRASRANLDATFAWIGDHDDGVRARGFSNPIPALEAALALRPDAVFLLSSAVQGSGQWDPDDAEVLRALDRLNPRDARNGVRPVTIKTIQYLKPDRDRLLWSIARDHGGEEGYSWFSRDDLESLRERVR